jgi:hypothetical protein
MKILVATANYYPYEKKTSSFFERNRNIYYKDNGLDFDILNFAAKNNTLVDNINVFNLSSIEKKLKNKEYKILLCHAPNLRNHFLFLLNYSRHFDRIILVFHGQEIVHTNKVYPKPFIFMKQSFLRYFFKSFYDSIKLTIWKFYFLYNAKTDYIFVSNSLKNDFFNHSKINCDKILGNIFVIPNGIGKIFELNTYNSFLEKKFDFITIRSNYDISVYCVDLIVSTALKHPNLKFLLIGKGRYFNFFNLPKNITLIHKHLNHDEMLGFIDQSKFALMPTRRDSQGVMACELATYGIPLITSKLPVTKEIFNTFSNVILVEEYNNFDFEKLIKDHQKFINSPKNHIYFEKNTSAIEFDLINLILNNLKG